MSAIAGLAMVFVLGIAVAGALLLYLVVRAEHDDRTVTDRETAENLARKDRHEDD